MIKLSIQMATTALSVHLLASTLGMMAPGFEETFTSLWQNTHRQEVVMDYAQSGPQTETSREKEGQPPEEDDCGVRGCTEEPPPGN